MPVSADFETVEVSTDLLILGGGFSACGAATEAAYWAKKNGLKVALVDKAALDRSGAVASGSDGCVQGRPGLQYRPSRGRYGPSF